MGRGAPVHTHVYECVLPYKFGQDVLGLTINIEKKISGKGRMECLFLGGKKY